MSDNDLSAASIRIEGEVVHCDGAWVVTHLHPLEKAIQRLSWPRGGLVFDLSALDRIDTAGAWLLHRLLQQLRQQGIRVTLSGASAATQDLLTLVEHSGVREEEVHSPRQPGPVEQLGRAAVGSTLRAIGLLAFVGEVSTAWVRQMLHPLGIRWTVVLQELGEAGYKALGIVGLLSFLLGIVIAYQGGVQLHKYAASIFVADLVGLSTVRELAPLITAIIVAGRTGSAYTAQIGTMKVTEEVDALRSIGIAPLDLLVLPKVLALFIALPLLTVYADLMGILGGMVMASAQLDVSFTTFMDRLGYAIGVQSYLVGMGKAPVFAVIIAVIGCYQGFQVAGSAESVGRHTTMSVVQSILAVIVVDAIFSVIFSTLGI